MGGKSRKTGGVSRRLIEQLKKGTDTASKPCSVNTKKSSVLPELFKEKK